MTTGILLILLASLLALKAEGPFAVAIPFAIALAALMVASWAVRHTRSQRLAYETKLTARAATDAAQAERLRIARELHDIVSHGLGLITIRAAATLNSGTPSSDTEETRALNDIEATARDATLELRRLLNVLRDETAPAPLQPAEDFTQLPDIIHQFGPTGVTVNLELEPEIHVSAGVQATICAITREALGNTARHAGPTQARVSIHRDGEHVVTTIRDAGRTSKATRPAGAGHGLRGLRERVTALGGTLTTELVEQGFHLTARIPDRHSAA